VSNLFVYLFGSMIYSRVYTGRGTEGVSCTCHHDSHIVPYIQFDRVIMTKGK
jgi:hypothetical protein